MILLRKIRTFINDPKKSVQGKLKPILKKKAERYLTEHGLWELLSLGDAHEFKIDAIDQHNLHRTIRRYRPKHILEFGIGFSTLTMAHALWMNATESGTEAGESESHIWAVDCSHKWIENTKKKIPSHLSNFVDIRHSESEIFLLNGQLCHLYKDIPNISPDLIYLDGPSPYDVSGQINGMSFVQETGLNRTVISADPILLESTFRVGFRMIVDGRLNNVNFLKSNFRRKYSIRTNLGTKMTTFILKERS